MIPQPPSPSRSHVLFPYTTLFRSARLLFSASAEAIAVEVERLAGLAVLITGDQIDPLVGIAALGVDQRRRRRLEARADAQIQVAARLDAAIAQRIGIDRLVGHLAGGAGNLALGTDHGAAEIDIVPGEIGRAHV